VSLRVLVFVCEEALLGYLAVELLDERSDCRRTQSVV
jgi:hypothetical protein